MKSRKIIGLVFAIELFACIWASGRCTVTNGQLYDQPSSLGTIGLPVEITCPKWHTKQTEHGPFIFPETKATDAGVVVRLECPYTALKSGAVSITGEELESEESGGFAVCKIVARDGALIGEWTSPEPVIKNCRKQSAYQKSNQMRTQIMDSQIPITDITIKQIIPGLLSMVHDAVEDFESAQVLVETISKFLEITEIFDNPMSSTLKEELFFALNQYTKNVKLKAGQKVFLVKGHIEVESVLFPPNSEKISSYEFASLRIPQEAIAGGTQAHGARLQIQAFDNDLFYLWGNARNFGDLHEKDMNTTDPEFLAREEFADEWRILDITFNGVKIENLTEPIQYKMRVNTSADYDWKCAFWDEQEEKWSVEGMTTTTLQDEIQCESTHLTAFSALIDPKPYSRGSDGSVQPSSFEIPPIHLHILSVLSSVGSAFSIAGLAMTSLTYALFRCLRKERSNKILLNLSTSLLLLHLMSVSSERDMWNGYCTAPAMLLHYFLLTSLGWMLVEGVHMYQLLISVFVKPETRFMLKRSLCAWGIPLILVIVSVLVDKEVYEAGRDDWCMIAGHLNLPLYYSTYLAPVAFCIAVNTFVFIRIVRVLYVQSSRTRQQQQMMSATSKNHNMKKSNNHDPQQSSACAIASARPDDWKTVKSHHLSPVQIKGALTVMLLLGVGWTVGLLAVGPFQIVLRYLFTACNAGQGAFIFLFRVVLHPQACRAWRKAVIGSNGDDPFSSSTSSSSSSSSGSITPGANNRKGHHVSRPSFSASPSPADVSNVNSAASTMSKTDTITTKLAAALLKLIQSNKNADVTGTAVIKKEDDFTLSTTFD